MVILVLFRKSLPCVREIRESTDGKTSTLALLKTSQSNGLCQ